MNPVQTQPSLDQLCINTIRTLSMDAVQAANSGHPGTPMAMAPVVYTLWLKRRTPQNIVIGGLAGALPPLVGWAAATGTAPLNAWLLVAIIFVWTPPHFWALSLYIQSDYAAAGVPMMPVVKGSASTRRQIFAYSLVLAALGLVPAFTGLGGRVYLVVAALGGLGFVSLATRLLLTKDSSEAPHAKALFRFSLLYLFGLFAALLVESLIR